MRGHNLLGPGDKLADLPDGALATPFLIVIFKDHSGLPGLDPALHKAVDLLEQGQKWPDPVQW